MGVTQIAALFAVISIACCMAGSIVPSSRNVLLANTLVPGNHPFLFLSVPQAESRSVAKNFDFAAEAIDDENDDDEMDDLANNEEDDDDTFADEDEPVVLNIAPAQHIMAKTANNADNAIALEDKRQDDDDADDDDEETSIPNIAVSKNAKSTNMLVTRDHAGSIMVPDGIIEIEGQSVYDEKTGKTALLVPRSALDAIPDGSVVALLERTDSSDADANEIEEERANRVIVRRRIKAGRRNIRRGRPVRRHRPVRRRRPISNRRPASINGVRRRHRPTRLNRVRVVRRGGKRRANQRRRATQRRRVQRPILLQG